MTVPGVHLAVPVVGVYGLLLAPVWLAVVIVHILPRPVRRVAVLLVVVILLVAAVAVKLLLLLMVQPAMGRQRAVPALLGFELLNCFVEGPELAKKAHVNLTQAHHFFSKESQLCVEVCSFTASMW